MKGSEYISAVNACIDKAWNTQKSAIMKAAEEIARATREKHNVYVFGCSHAGIIAEEVFYRSGGMVTVNPIMFPGFMLNTRPITLTSKLEKVSGIAKALIEENGLSKGDTLIIHSVSGRNTVPVEMASEARARGVYVCCITNLEYSRSVSSRSPDKKRLFEVSDTVIDNCGCIGDAAVSLDGLPERIGATSTAVGAAIINSIIIEAVEILLSEGITPPVFMSANLDGGAEHNAKILEEYSDNIKYM